MLSSLTRRALVLRGGASTAGVAGSLIARDTLAAPATQPVFRLVACDSCAACQACVRHAENKLFASVKAADANRAHAGCNCGIANDTPLPRRTWIRLFGPVKHPDRLVVDRRNAEVAELLG